MVLTYRNILWLCFVLGTSAIGIALFYEHVLNYQPCALCYEERIPYYILLMISTIALITDKFIGKALFVGKPLLGLLGVLMLFSCAYGSFHAGVEWGFWPGPSSCVGGATADATSDLFAMVQDTKIVPCDFANWRLFGISFAGYNALVSALISVLLFIGVINSDKKPKLSEL